jgi:Asp-tRNA(Asn)/Glu-tRNA(Gln) amidotransferase A subunit family amidase
MTRIPGGSSGGSGASVAAGMGFASIGTDSGGSIGIPAAYSGVVGLKPTFGLVSRYGLLPLAGSLDHAGPLTRTVEDAALVLAAIAGHDPRDPASADIPVSAFTGRLESGAHGLRLGVIEARVAEADAEVAAAVRLAVEGLAAAGAEVRSVTLALQDAARAAVVDVLAAEATATLQDRLRAHPDWFGADVRERLARGELLVPRHPRADLLAVVELPFHLLLPVRIPEAEVSLRTIVSKDALLALLTVLVPAGHRITHPFRWSTAIAVRGRKVRAPGDPNRSAEEHRIWKPSRNTVPGCTGFRVVPSRWAVKWRKRPGIPSA